MDKKTRVTVSCGTKFHSDYAAYQLSKRGLLNKIVTSHPAKYYLNRVPLEKEKVKFLPPIFVLSFGFKKLLGNSNKISSWLDYRLPLLFDWMASRSLNGSNVLMTWAWSGLRSIKQIKKKGGTAIVEECGSCNYFQNKILNEEYDSLGLKFETPTPQFILDRQLEEAKLADYVLCPSQHVARSFVQFGIPQGKCKVIPYGVNLGIFKQKDIQKDEFTILFVGTVGVRKGLIYLFRALEQLQSRISVKCIVIGTLETQFEKIFREYAHLFTYITRVPHHELVEYYNRASVFVFPSLDEGMAYVQLEAMACGLPVICTPNSGGDSVIEEGRDGFIVPIRDAEAISRRIEYLYRNPSVLKEMSLNAQLKASAFSWDHYGDKLAGFINSFSLNQSN